MVHTVSVSCWPSAIILTLESRISIFAAAAAAAAAAAKSLQSCPTLRPHRRQPTRLPHPWDFPSKNTGVGSIFAGFL